MRRPRRFALLALLLPALVLACSDSETVDEQLLATCSSNPTATGARVYLACGTVNGNMVSVDIYAQEVGQEVDGYNIRVTFAPTVFQYRGFVDTATPFGACDGSSVICTQNAGANTDGEVVYGVTRPPATSGSLSNSKTLLGTLMFEAVHAADTGLSFTSPQTTTQCVSDTTSGTALYRDNITCLSTFLEIVGGISWDSADLQLGAGTP
jgi:hypothetical protein